ncbi:AraC family transcriptional regulator [Paenibacillus protaetiae]|uniref:AraC family transcriptional regulator n=1 Tax=Paenibacillus protaetiae TaxID=2509456 RepID=A0A4P6F2D0_9BACL|nr:AraC family transcriptional regulator [Paenibacillus protaetiae]QAY67237.1 AraC family transcriptional regulator [Paenibacillus protaetiae]
MAVFKYNADSPQRDNPDLHLLYWGKEDCVPGHAVGPLIRDHYKIHLIHKGTGFVRIGERKVALTAGQGFIIFPHVVTYYEADRQQPWTYSWIGFQGEKVQPILEQTSLAPEEPVFAMDLKLMPELYDRLTEAASRGGSSGLYLQALLYEYMAALVENAPLHPSAAVSPKKQDAYVHQSMEFIHTHYGEDISVFQLAASLGLDRKYLSSVFKEAVGMPPQQYLLQYRMDRACELLAGGRYTVAEVARSVGYRDALLFSRMFKKMRGVPPTRYRERERH